MNTPDRLDHALAERYRSERELGQSGMATVYVILPAGSVAWERCEKGGKKQ